MTMLPSTATLLISLLVWAASACLVASQPPPQGQYNATNRDDVQTLHMGHLCAKDDADMARLYEENLDDDLLFWRNKLQGKKLNMTVLNQMWLAQHHTADWYISSQHNVVLIKDNKLYYPFRTFEEDVDCFKKGTWCDGRMQWDKWAFERWTKDLGITFPDVIFFMDIGDSGGCTEANRCPGPTFAYFKQKLQYEFPMERYGASPPAQSTILLPSLYTDLNRDFTPTGGAHTYAMYYYPFDKKLHKAFFRGGGVCPEWHRSRFVRCPRWHLTNESIFNGHGDLADVLVNGWGDPDRKLPPMTHVPLKEHAKYKFLFSFDGVGPSNRFAKLMSINSVILKEDSPFIAHFYRSVHPYVHYIPIMTVSENDYVQVLEKYKGQDEELKRIAANAQHFMAKYLCDRALALYTRKALTEYKNLFEDMQGYIDNYIWPLMQAKQRIGIDPEEFRKTMTSRRQVRRQGRRLRGSGVDNGRWP